MQSFINNPHISVMILTRNRLEVARSCLKSVLMQDCESFEVVILDDASDDTDTASMLAAEFADSRVRPFHSNVSLGVAGGRNFLMEMSRGEILVSIDDDAVFLTANNLSTLTTIAFEKPHVGIVAFRITNVVGGKRSPLVPFDKVALNRNPGLVDHSGLVSSFKGGGHAIRREVISKIGLYRHDMMFGEEEMDLAYRAVQSQYLISYEPAIVLEHFPMPSVIAVKQRRASELYYHVRNRSYLAYRYLPLKYLVTYWSVWLAVYTVRGMREGTILDLIRGLVSVPSYLRGVERRVLDHEAISYLERHGGRLWY